MHAFSIHYIYSFHWAMQGLLHLHKGLCGATGLERSLWAAAVRVLSAWTSKPSALAPGGHVQLNEDAGATDQCVGAYNSRGPRGLLVRPKL